jgi:hypothetical protein
MKKLLHLSWALAMILIIAASPGAASADATTHVVIDELQTGTTASAGQEFIELYNPMATAVSLSGWTIEYKSATSADTPTNWSKRASLGGRIAPGGFYLMAPMSYLPDADTDWSATLAGSAGTIRLKDDSGNVIDELGYGVTANSAEALPAAAPPAGQSIERLPGRLDELAGNGVDTDNNSADFVIRMQPGPQSTTSAIELADATTGDDGMSDPTITDSPTPSEDTPDAPAVSDYAPIDITELLPNPMAPQLDSQDEFIELYNPTADPVDLQGYTLRTGSNFHDYYVLPGSTIAAGAYQVVYASQTKLTMPNTGGAVELLDPSGTTVDQTPSYEAAPDGQSWAYFDSGWAWTLQLTPGQPNVLAALAPLPATAKVTKPKTTVKKATTTKKKTKAAAKKTTKKRKAAKTKPVSAVPQLVAERSLQPANWLIIILAALTIGYAIYEFRYDIYNLYYQLRGHTPPGAGHRSAASRRGDD